MKLFKRIVLLFVFLFLLIAGTLVVIAFVYQDEVKEYMLREVNKHLKTKVMVDSKNINFSFLKDFPMASLTFRDVLMLDPVAAKPVKDTLLFSSNFSLQFNLFDILDKKFIVKKIKIENGQVKLKVAADGTVNWDVWKETSDADSSAGESAFNLEKIQLYNMALLYSDIKNKNTLSLLINHGRIKGEFTSEKYDLSLTGDLLINYFSSDDINYLDRKPSRVDFSLSVDNKKGIYRFTDALVQIAGLRISVAGKYIQPSSFVDIQLKGKDIDLQSVLSLLPQKYHEYINDYESEGSMFCNVRIKGKTDERNFPEITAEFGILNGEIIQQSTGIVLQNVHLNGKYLFSSEKSYLEMKNISAKLSDGTISGNFSMENFSSPLISASLQAQLSLSDMKHLLKIDTLWNYPIESLAGNFSVNLEYKGKVNHSGKYTKADFENMNLSGEAVFENAAMKIQNSALAFDNINGSFTLDNNRIAVNSFSGKTDKSDFYLKGNIKNILAFSFVDDADMDIEASFQSKNFDLNEFLVSQQGSSKKDTVYKISFSPRINFILGSSIGHLSFRKFEAENIEGTFQLRNQKLIADPVSFSIVGGFITASGMIDGTKGSMLLISCNANLNKLNISKLFYQFEDFNQSTITHRHLKGIASAEVQFASVWKSDLTIDANKIYVRSNVTIEKGELLRFEPLKALSKYIAVAELEEIKFAALQNQIEIKNQKIFIPKMDVHSSVMDVSLWGTHTFDNEIDYHIKVALADVLFQKARKAKKENAEFGIVEEDKSGRTSLFLSMTGTVENPIIKYDRQGAKQQLKENIALEKHTLKQILREEFGWFKKDTTLNKKIQPKEEEKFIIKWDEEEEKKKQEEDDDF